MNIRQLHAYIGLLIAPSVLFFALTGALQIFSLHEAHGGYTPPPLIEKLSSVHKDQVFAAGHHHDAPPKAAAKAAPPKADDDDDKGPALGTVLLKWYFLAVALALALTTGFGVWIGLTHVRHRRVGWILVIAGAVLPIVLLLV